MKEEIKMKNRMKKLLVLATAATMMTAAFTGCGSSSDGAYNNADTGADGGTSNENLSGSLPLAVKFRLFHLVRLPVTPYAQCQVEIGMEIIRHRIAVIEVV